MYIYPVEVTSKQSGETIRVAFSPSARVLSSPAFDKDVLNDFLSAKGTQDNTQLVGERPGAALVETAGRVCYMSFEKPRPGGSKVYIEHILEVGHGSVLENANYSFLTYGVSRSLTHELVRHRAGWAYCLAGDTVVYSGSKCNGRFDGYKRRWTMEKLYKMSLDPKRKGRLKLIKLRCYDGVNFVQTGIKRVVCSGEKELLEVTLADGKKISCSADHRFLTVDGWRAVRELQVGQVLATNGLKAIGIDKGWLTKRYREDGALLEEIAKEAKCSPRTVRIYLRKYNLQKAIGQGMIGRSPPNKGTRYRTGYRHKEETKSLLSQLKKGDRNPQWRGLKASPQAGRQRAQKLFPTAPCESCGVAEGHRHHKNRNTLDNSRNNISFLCNPCHGKLHAMEDGPTNLLKVKWVAISSIKPVGRGMTYDLEVDHEAHNFVANGFVTHNSQLSQRFVDEKQVGFVVPPRLLNAVLAALIGESHLFHCNQSCPNDWSYLWDRFVKPFSYEEQRNLQAVGSTWLEARVKNLLEYRITTDNLIALYESERKEMSPTDFRKMMRQTARNCLPNCTETYLVMTANIRAIRHFISMRGAKAADEEIRNLAMVIAETMRHHEPNLFQDLTIEKDHCFLKHPKV